MHDAGTSSVEWAILGLAIAIFVSSLLLLVDLRRHGASAPPPRPESPRRSSDEPLDCATGERDARGEMTREEYSQLLGDPGRRRRGEGNKARRPPGAERETQ